MPVRGSTRLLAVAGDPVAHSLSPAMHNAAIAALGLDAVYVAARTTAPALPALVEAMLEAGGALNVTAPFKLLAARLVHEPTDDALLTGACNTIWGEPGRVRGDNTDIAGIRHAVRELMAGSTVTRARVFGTGASARSTAVAVSREWPGAVIGVHSRERERERDFLAWAAGAGISAEVAGTIQAERRDLDVDTTAPTARWTLRDVDRGGVEHPERPMPRAFLDLNYGQGAPSHLLPGVRAADGREVLVVQGAASFERFFGISAPVDVMRAAVEAALRG